MNIMRAFHELAKLAVQTHGGKPSDYNTPITWQCAGAAVKMQDDMDQVIREHREYGRLRVAIAATRMTYAMRTAAVR